MSEQKNWYDNSDSEPENKDTTGNENSDDYVKRGSYNDSYRSEQTNGQYYNQYNNQYTQYYGRPLNPPGTNPRFGGAAFGCGIAALATTLTGVFPIILGALGLIFTNLSRRRGAGYPSRAKAGMIMSIIGIVIGLFLTINSFIYVVTMMNSEEFYNEINTTYQMLYGEDIDMDAYEELFNLFGKN